MNEETEKLVMNELSDGVRHVWIFNFVTHSLDHIWCCLLSAIGGPR